MSGTSPPQPPSDIPADAAARGDALWAAGDALAAVAAYAQALGANPQDARSAMNLSHALAACGNPDAALSWMRYAHAINPADPVLTMNLGTIHQRRGEIEEAATCYAQAIERRPEYAAAWLNYGNAALYCGDPVAAVERFERALAHGPHLERALSNIIYGLSYVPGATPREIRRRAEEWDRRFALPRLPDDARLRDTRTDRPLRVGYVSPDLGTHPIGYFLEGVLAHHASAAVQVTVYSERAVEDPMTERLKALVPTWCKTVGVPDTDLAAQIARDEIDILVDMAGHTSGNRLRVFTAKPAPIQMTWGIGSVGTTGLSAIDYLIADRFHVPSGDEPHFVEKVLRLPDALVCYAPPASAPPASGPPMLRNGFVTFGCFSNPAKIASELIALWAAILRDTPNSRLLLKYRWMNSSANRQRIEAAFARAGVARDRLVIEGESPQSELLARYNDVDIALDTAPYSGGVTTLEALWMGVPVVARPEPRVAGRHSLAFLSVLGLETLVGADASGYRRIAVELASRPAQLTTFRHDLRGRLAASALCDGARFVRHLEAVYRQLWHKFIGLTRT